MLGLKDERFGRDYKKASHKRENERRRRQIERGIIKI
jgi:hypothetical protein